MNKWKNIWESKKSDEKTLGDIKDVQEMFLELKRLDGFDTVQGGIPYQSLINQYKQIKEYLIDLTQARLDVDNIESVYEVGCGSGANLYLLENDGYRTGGIDYSSSLLDAARQVLKSNDLTCDEAKNLNVHPEYDVLLSNSVFSYFESDEYAKEVVERMIKKANYGIGLVDIHDVDLKDAYTEYKRSIVPNYDELYKDLNKHYYSKDFFRTIAEENGLDISFVDFEIPGYWNNDYVFNCFMYKDPKTLKRNK